MASNLTSCKNYFTTETTKVALEQEKGRVISESGDASLFNMLISFLIIFFEVILGSNCRIIIILFTQKLMKRKMFHLPPVWDVSVIH